jgi:hypothetical protein
MKTKRKRAASTKPKKVTVKFFINKVVMPVTEGKTKRYPLYMLITYDRKNTMMRCHYGKYYKDLNEVDKVHYPGLMTMEEKVIRKTISYELAQRENEFDLKGTNKKYDQYAIGIHVLLERHLKNQLWSVLSRLEPFEYVKALNFTDPDVEFSTLYKMAKKVYKDLPVLQPKNFEQEIEIYQAFMKLYQGSFFQYGFPVVIEWLDGSVVEDYRNKLTVLYPDSPSTIKKSIEFIDRIVQSVLEYRNI